MSSNQNNPFQRSLRRRDVGRTFFYGELERRISADEILALSILSDRITALFSLLDEGVILSLNGDKTETIEKTRPFCPTTSSGGPDKPLSKKTNDIEVAQPLVCSSISRPTVNLDELNELIDSIRYMDRVSLHLIAYGQCSADRKKDLAANLEKVGSAVSSLKTKLKHVKEVVQRCEQGKAPLQHLKEESRKGETSDSTLEDMRPPDKSSIVHTPDDSADEIYLGLTKQPMLEGVQHERIQLETRDLLQANLEALEGLERVAKAAHAGNKQEFKFFKRELYVQRRNMAHKAALLKNDVRTSHMAPS